MDVLNPANITSALLILAEKGTGPFLHISNEMRKKFWKRANIFTIKCDIRSLYFFFLLYEILNLSSLFWSVWVLSDLEDKSVNCF